MAHECTMCGACCVAPDIAALDKPLGLRCPNLGEDSRCLAYEARPAVCRSYSADELCDLIAAPTIEERVKKYLAHFGLDEEAARVKATGLTSRARVLERFTRSATATHG
ncbi:MAG: zinc/iron-chelating domain-containing protein [Archangium gephyra]|uniref:Zinc/iron-chelating domain-containing protein n=1 Tax=Archangium gephyra TaxID=48 RepID=A0A2W5SPL1_9BACT|nr:MAG: zinc/iron-chelating domain-containing protein [Archangium gephyra]